MRQLIKFGTGKHSAIVAGLSRKGYWRLSRTLSTHNRDANAWLTEQDVISLKELWGNIDYPEGKASKHRLRHLSPPGPPGADPHAVVAWGPGGKPSRLLDSATTQ